MAYCSFSESAYYPTTFLKSRLQAPLLCISHAPTRFSRNFFSIRFLSILELCNRLAPPERGILFRLWVYKRVWISWVEVYERERVSSKNWYIKGKVLPDLGAESALNYCLTIWLTIFKQKEVLRGTVNSELKILQNRSKYHFWGKGKTIYRR